MTDKPSYPNMEDPLIPPQDPVQDSSPANEIATSAVNANNTEINDANTRTNDMEVHHHAHHHGNKNWKAYAWEFLMLFLAVFCGFLAEYQLEHVIEGQREKQYVRSLVEDLRNDQQAITQHIAEVKQSALLMDTLVNILNDAAACAQKTGDLYYLARLAPRLKPLSTNSRTFEQLKNSGNFRLIKNLATSNKIMAYYEKLPLIHLLENINETEFTEYKKVAVKIFNPAIFLQREGKNDAINRGSDNPPLRVNDPELLQELSCFAVYLHGTKKGIIGASDELNKAGASLLGFLEAEYGLRE